MKDTTWWRVAKEKEISAKGYFVCSREKESVSPRDNFFGSKAAKNSFKNF